MRALYSMNRKIAIRLRSSLLHLQELFFCKHLQMNSTWLANCSPWTILQSLLHVKSFHPPPTTSELLRRHRELWSNVEHNYKLYSEALSNKKARCCAFESQYARTDDFCFLRFSPEWEKKRLHFTTVHDWHCPSALLRHEDHLSKPILRADLRNKSKNNNASPTTPRTKRSFINNITHTTIILGNPCHFFT